MRAFLKNYRQAPRKVRLLAGLIRGKHVARARTILSFVPKRAAEPIRKLIASATANAKEQGITDEKELIIKEIKVDEGVTFMRSMPKARGRATPIRKKTSHITLSLAQQSNEK
jgi:large subunit ribosomal protein L22